MGELVQQGAVQTPYSMPLISASNLHRLLSELKFEFTSREAEDLMTYAVIGSSPTPQEAMKKLKEVEHLDPATEIVHFGHFIRSLEETYSKHMELTARTAPQNIQEQTQEEKRIQIENLHVIGKIKGMLKDRDVSIWEAIVYSNMTISEQTKITLTEFKLILNSLNLDLTLREKITLYRIVDPEKTGKVDLQHFINLIEEKGLNERALKAVLEKFAISLFFNDMSLKKLFDQFDLDQSQEISPNEFRFGIAQLDLGLSIFEINQLMKIFDKDADDKITRVEFVSTLEELFQKYSIDPSRDLSFSVYAKIKHLTEVKGVNLIEAFQEVDYLRNGWVDMEGLKKALSIFGLEKLHPYQITALLKFNPANPASGGLDSGGSRRGQKSEKDVLVNKRLMLQQQPRRGSGHFRDPSYKVYYKEFTENLMVRNLKALSLF